MKIGILTFHRARNYGAVLQCYALFSYLTSLGHNVEVVDYYPQYFIDEYSLFSKKHFLRSPFCQKIRMVLLLILTFIIKRKRIKVFDSFIHNMIRLTPKTYSETDIDLSGFDMLFFGSDQIWNPKLTKGFDKVFTGSFDKQNAVFVAYATSTTLSEDMYSDMVSDKIYRDIVSRFDFVSTRELEFKNYLNSFKLKEVIQVLDPVFLLNKEQWYSFSSRPKETNYLLLYCVPFEKKHVHFAKKIAKVKGLKLIEIASIERPCYSNSVKQTITPQEFVGYFCNASFVLTSSFHGTAFSVLLQKDFLTILKGNSYDGRAYNLLKMFGLDNRAILVDEVSSSKNKINYEKINASLRDCVESSRKFIDRAVNFNN